MEHHPIEEHGSFTNESGGLTDELLDLDEKSLDNLEARWHRWRTGLEQVGIIHTGFEEMAIGAKR